MLHIRSKRSYRSLLLKVVVLNHWTIPDKQLPYPSKAAERKLPTLRVKEQ